MNTANSGEDIVTVAYSAATGAPGYGPGRYPNAVGYQTALVVSPDGSDLFVTGTETSKGVQYYTDQGCFHCPRAQVWMRRYLAHLGSAVSIAVSRDGSEGVVNGDVCCRTVGAVSRLAPVSPVALPPGAQLWTARHKRDNRGKRGPGGGRKSERIQGRRLPGGGVRCCLAKLGDEFLARVCLAIVRRGWDIRLATRRERWWCENPVVSISAAG